MTAIAIFTTEQTSRFSKVFRVDKGFVQVITSFNFSCQQLNEIGEVTRPGDRAVLHRVELNGDTLPTWDGCTCVGGVFEGLSVEIISSEPVVQCAKNWQHNSQNNVSVLSVPGYYMFEICNEDSVGTVSMTVEELTIAEAQLLPKALYLGEM